ncbi:MAG: CpsD/CapB family tyrosine-protein kinase, partial [Deltaproteobacteria bacterium]|nr:CpsD/CapB family tyrosine-protein kinase [Deltaproteobacteria bacterium]
MKSDKESKAATITKKPSPFKLYDRKAREKGFSGAIKTIFKSKDVDKNIVSFLEPQSFEAEQFKHLKTNILFPVSGNPPRSIMVTSAVPGEGKSFVASNLAVSIAQNIDQHVLLMDCDMRKASVHSNFGFDEVEGLSGYLSKETSLSSLLLKTDINKLTILPGGKPPNNPAELMSSNKMSELLKEVTSRYNDRYIIIDSPPPHITS